MMNSPHDWGMRPSSVEDPCQEEAGWPLGKMIVVVVVVVAAAVGCSISGCMHCCVFFQDLVSSRHRAG